MKLIPIHGRNFIYSIYDRKVYKLVFDHDQNYGKCFDSENDARHNNSKGMFSILDDLSSSTYIMEDNLRHFILDYPLLEKINIFQQLYSPLDDIEKPRNYIAVDFKANLTEIPSNEWGGLVKNTMKNDGRVTTLIDGHPGRDTYYYAIGLYCTAHDRYIERGLPTNDNDQLTKHVRLWAMVPATYDMIYCPSIQSYYFLNYFACFFVFLLLPPK